MKPKKETNAEPSVEEEKELTAQEAPGNRETGSPDYRELFLRLKAELDNTRKIFEREKMDAIRYANEKLLTEIIPVVDNFERAMGSFSEGHDAEKVKTGLKIAQDELHQVLQRHGVQIVESKGKDFDPKVHEAVAVVETDEAEDGAIVDEFQKGYTLNGRLIRPSRVRIAKKTTENR